jgi:hypothetical protein
MAKDEPKQRSPRRARGAGGAAGAPIRPADVPADAGCETSLDRPKSAPAPGVPMSIAEYERLKEQAKRRPARRDAPAQEDSPRSRPQG